MPQVSKGYKGKKKADKKKECKGVDCGSGGEYKMAKEQHSLEKTYKQSKKVKEKEVFGKKPKKMKAVPKGSHRMPDGSIMKDSEMKKKKKSNTY